MYLQCTRIGMVHCLIDMDVSLFHGLLVLIAVFSLLLLFAIRKPSQNRGDARRRLPPSPPGLPVIGHLPSLGSLPHRKLRSMATSYGPVMLLRFGRVPTVVASSAAAAQEIMKTHDLAYASRPRMRMVERLSYGRDLSFAPYGEHWRQARRVCVLHLLSQRRVHYFRHDREQEAATLIHRVRSAGDKTAVNLSALIISYTNGIISRAAFGDNGDSFGNYGGEELMKLFADHEELLGKLSVGEFVPWLAWVDRLMGLDAKVTRSYNKMGALLDRVIEDHRQRRRAGGCRKDDDRRDFVDVLLDMNEAAEAPEDTADAAGRGGVMFDNGSIKGIVRNMFAAGTNTSYTTLVWAMAELINHPHEMRKVQDEIRAAVAGDDDVNEDHLEKLRYLKCVIKETLRLHAPVPLLPLHETMEDTELLGYHVPACTRVTVNAWAIARDPATWERTEEFVPERFTGDDLTTDYLPGQDFRFVPFGGGRRGCPGVGFAVPVMELALASLLYHFDWELPAGAASKKLDMDEVHGLSVRHKATLYLVAKPRAPQ